MYIYTCIHIHLYIYIYAKSVCCGSVTEQRANRGCKRKRQDSTVQRHDTFLTGGVLWCRLCGSYPEQRVQSLFTLCDGSGVSRPRASQLARLRAGRHPLRNAFLGRPQKVIAVAVLSPRRRL